MSDKPDDKESEEKRGRPSIFTEALAAKIIELYSTGMTQVEICENLGISPRALTYWIRDNDDFMLAMKKARNIADGIVEEALFRNATQHMNVTAQIFWLKNRQPENWRDKQSIETLGPDGKPIEPTQVILNIPRNNREADDE